MDKRKRSDKIDIDLEDLDDESSQKSSKIDIDLPKEQDRPKRSVSSYSYSQSGVASPSSSRSYQSGSRVASSGALDYPKSNIGKRILAYLVDSFILFIVAGIGVVIIYSSLPQIIYGRAGSGSYIMIFIFSVLFFFIPLIWFLIRDGLGNGQSIGKKMLGLMVVRIEDNRPCTKGNSVVRNLIGSVLSGIDETIVLFHGKGHRLGDMLMNTQVIEVDEYRQGSF